jgi:hypothetical protein
MERFLKLVQQLVPLIAFYPSWAQLLFLTTFSLFLASTLTFVVFYSPAAARKEAADAASNLPPDVRQEIGKSLTSLSTLEAELGLSLANYYSSAVSLRLHLLDYTLAHPDIQSYLSSPLTDPLKEDVKGTIQAIEDLRKALAAIQKDEFAAACWRRAGASADVNALRRIRDELLKRGFSASDATIEIADLPNVTQFLSFATKRLAGFSFKPLLEAVLATNAADIEGVGMSYDHAALRSFVFSGNLIFTSIVVSKGEPKRDFVVSWGSAMLLDVFRAMPTASSVRAELQARHPAHRAALESFPIGLDRDAQVGSDFRTAVSELEKRPGLLFLELPPGKRP